MSDYQPGIYKTTKYLPGHEAVVGPDQLVLIRTDGEFAPASVLVPVRNEFNQWQFRMPGVKIPPASLNWSTSLVKLPREGFYRLKRVFIFGDEKQYTWTVNTLVQLGFTLRGDPILFIGQRRSPLASNDLFFGDKGVKIELSDVDGLLEALVWAQEPSKQA
jgi:hypothetical protein